MSVRPVLTRKHTGGLGVLFGLGILAGTASPAWAESAPTEADFVLHMRRAQQHIESDEYKDGLWELQKAFAMKPQPRLLYLQGLMQLGLGNKPEALALFQLFVEAPGKGYDRTELHTAVRHINDLRQSLGRQAAAGTAPALGSAPQTAPALDAQEWLRRVNVWPTESRRPRGLIIIGAVTLGAGWLSSIAIGAASGSSAGTYRTADYSRYWPEFVPVAGPWIQLAYHLDGLTVFAGLTQATGLTMLIVGATSHHRLPVPIKNGLVITPLLVAPESPGVAVLGRFE